MIKVVVYSTDDKRFKKFVDAHIGHDLNILRIKDAKSVSEAYQNLHKYADEFKGYEHTLLIHDDVEMKLRINKKESIIKKLLDESSDKALIGLAGSKVYDPRHSNIMWWSNKLDLVGKVGHMKIEGRWLKKWMSHFGEYDKTIFNDDTSLEYSNVKVVDGLFLMGKTEYIIKGNPFNGASGNHFYDIRASLNSDNVYAINFECYHWGLGDSMLSEDYRIEAQRLIYDIQTGKVKV